MITVQLSGTALTVRGHAGFSRYGSDIVCAAASMLAFTLAAAMERLLPSPFTIARCGTGSPLTGKPSTRQKSACGASPSTARAMAR